MQSMETLILGIGDAFTRLHFGSSAALRAPGGGVVLIDCPDPIHRVLHAAGETAGGPWRNLRAEAVTDILLTHLHGDHSNGLESFGFYTRILRLKAEQQGTPPLPKPRLWASEFSAQRLWQKLAPAMAGSLGRTLEDFFEMHPLVPGQVAQVAGLKVECRVTTHPLHCLGFRITHPDGGTLGWSGDTGFEEAHVMWLAKAQVVVHEANHPPAHSDIKELMKLPEEIQRKLRLIHLSDGFDASAFGLRALKEGEVISF